MNIDLATINVTLADGVATLELNRPDKANAMNPQMWLDIGAALRWVDETPAARVAIRPRTREELHLGHRPRHAGGPEERSSRRVRRPLARKAATENPGAAGRAFSAIERCRKPVIAAIHGACFGGGIDLITCCRHALRLQRRVLLREGDRHRHGGRRGHAAAPAEAGRPDGIARELAYTGRTFDAAEAKRNRLAEPGVRRARGPATRRRARSPRRSPPSRRFPFAASRKWSSTRATIRWPMA